MRKTRISKLVVILAAVMLLVGAAVGTAITASASDSAVTSATVGRRNVVYKNYTHLAIEVENVTVASGELLGLIAWDGVTANTNVETASYITYSLKEGTDADNKAVKYFVTEGIAASDIFVSDTYALCVRAADGSIRVLENTVFTYSVAEYAAENVASASFNYKQVKLYQKLMSYGKNAYAMFNKSGSTLSETVADCGYSVVETVGGYVGYTEEATMGGVAGKNVIIRAEAVNAEGKFFSHWEYNGEALAIDRVSTITVPTEAGIHTYTAVYAEDSKYNSQYTVSNSVVQTVTTVKGDTYYYLDKQSGAGQTVTVTNTNGAAADQQVFEVDIQYYKTTEKEWVGRINVFSGNLKCLISTKITSAGTITICSDNNRYDVGSYKLGADAGHIASYKIVLDTSTDSPTVTVYINGVLVGTLDNVFTADGKSAGTSTDNAVDIVVPSDYSSANTYGFTSVGLFFFKNEAGDFGIDNISYYE